MQALGRRPNTAFKMPFKKFMHYLDSSHPVDSYEARLEQEIEFYRGRENVHDLPGVFHYWSNKYLVPRFRPFGFSNPQEFYCKYMTGSCIELAPGDCKFVSVGAGNCELDVDIVERLVHAGVHNFKLECLDVNPSMLERGKAFAAERNVLKWMDFSVSDINAWNPSHKYHVVLAIQCLHHFVELELLFSKVREALHANGFFVTDDMIGRNGHMRWPEALEIVNQLWAELPDRYKYNHQLKRLEREFVNWDCSKEGFEGIRAQDILPLLLEQFNFDFFIGFGNIIDPFVDRSFGHNFDAAQEFDRAFIDRVQALDDKEIELGRIKPTHMMAAMTTGPTVPTVYKHLTPEFCVRPQTD